MDPTIAVIVGIIALLAVALSSGSRGSKAEPIAGDTFYGDSATRCGWYDSNMVLHHHSPDIVQMVSALTGRPAVNRAINGLPLLTLIRGGSVPNSSLGEGAVDVPPLEQQLRADPGRFVVLGCGHVDAMFSSITAEDFRLLVLHAVALVQEAGKTPVLRGLNRFVANDRVTPDMLARRDQFDAIIRQAAETSGVRFVDVSAVDFYGSSDICEDGVHATPDYCRRIAAAIAQTLKT